MRAIIGLGACLLAGAPSTFAVAADIPADYDACLAQVATNPRAAERAAGEWTRFGGGAPARHCYALALVAVGAPDRAIRELLGIVEEEPDLSDAARTDILVQAGELLLDADDVDAAGSAAQRALQLSPKSRGGLGLRAAVQVARQNYDAAIRDLDDALNQGVAEPRLLIRRAAAYRLRGSLIAARDDAAFATERSPGMAAAWLEKGRIEAGLDDRRNARESFLKAISLDGAGEVGRAAQIALQKMEAGID